MLNYITDAEVRAALKGFKVVSEERATYALSLCDLFPDGGVNFSAPMSAWINSALLIEMLKGGWEAFDGKVYLDIEMFVGKDKDGNSETAKILSVIATHLLEDDINSKQVFKIDSCLLGKDNSIIIDADLVLSSNFSISVNQPIEILSNFGVCAICSVSEEEENGNMTVTPLRMGTIKELITIKNG